MLNKIIMFSGTLVIIKPWLFTLITTYFINNAVT